MIQESTMGKLSHTIKRFMIPNVFCKVFATWFSQCSFAKCLLHDSPNGFCLLHRFPNGFCKVFATWFSQWILFATSFSQWILQSVCYMILPMYFAKCLLHGSPNVLYVVKYLLHDSPNVFCKVFVTWFFQCIFAKYLLHDSQCNLQLFGTWLANT
jgi:hypothetical protein